MSYREEKLKRAIEDAAIEKDVGPLQGTARGYIGEAGNVSDMGATEAPDVHWLLANRRNQLLREAEAIQALIDALPSKLPHAAAQALRTLVLK